MVRGRCRDNGGMRNAPNTQANNQAAKTRRHPAQRDRTRQDRSGATQAGEEDRHRQSGGGKSTSQAGGEPAKKGRQFPAAFLILRRNSLLQRRIGFTELVAHGKAEDLICEVRVHRAAPALINDRSEALLRHVRDDRLP